MMRNVLIVLTVVAVLAAVVALLWPTAEPAATGGPLASAMAGAGGGAGKAAVPPAPGGGAEAPKPKALLVPPPRHDEAVTLYSGAEVRTWQAGSVGGAPYRAGGVINFGRGQELNHHRVTVSYTGSGKVQVYVASSTGAALAAAIKKAPSFRTVANGAEALFVSSSSGVGYAWILMRTTGQVNVTGVRHVCWRGRGTLYGHEGGVFTFASAELRYRLMYPRRYDRRKAYPLVISISGSGGVGRDNAVSMHQTNLARYLFTHFYRDTSFECFSLVPQIPPARDIPAPYWPRGTKGAPDKKYHPDWATVNEGGWYVRGVLALIGRLIEDDRVNIDADRVYYTGYSYGGKACWEFLRDGRDVFAGALCVSGWPIGRAFSDPDAEMLKRLTMEVRRHKHIPVVIFSGEKDPMRYGSRAVGKALQAAKAASSYIEFPGADHGGVPGGAYRNRKHIAWLFAQNRKKNPPAGKDPYPGGVYPAAP